MSELKLVSTKPLPDGNEERVYKGDGRQISVCRIFDRFEFRLPGGDVVEMKADNDRLLSWEQVARAGLAFTA